MSDGGRGPEVVGRMMVVEELCEGSGGGDLGLLDARPV